MVTTYRVFKTIHSANWNDGEGSFRYGGRWNSRGVSILYTAASLSLATLEMLVHLEDEEVLSDYSFATVQFDESLVIPVEKLGRLPADWRDFPVSDAVRQIGDEWVLSRSSVMLRAPTAILPREYNYLVNLEHPDAQRVELGSVERFVFDTRFTERKTKK